MIGVVKEVRISGFVAADDRVGAYYFPHAQDTDRGMTLTIRAAGESDGADAARAPGALRNRS